MADLARRRAYMAAYRARERELRQAKANEREERPPTIHQLLTAIMLRPQTDDTLMGALGLPEDETWDAVESLIESGLVRRGGERIYITQAGYDLLERRVA